mgnify:CR=1 FL=1
MSEKTVHAGHRARMKERFMKEGLSGFSEHEVLELLLMFAIPQRDVNPLAHRLIERFGSLSAVLETAPSELKRVDGVGENGAGVRRAYLSFRKAGMRHLDIRIYPGMRHEILNETARSLVYEDVLSWLQQRRVTQ